MRRAYSPMLRLFVALLAVGLATQLLPGGESRGKPQENRAQPPPPFWTYQDILAKRTPQTYTIRKGHPRLLITPDNKKEIIAKIKAGPDLWRGVIRDANANKGEEGLLSCAAIYQIGLVPGFKYAHTRIEYGRRGVESLMKWDPSAAFGRRGPINYTWEGNYLLANPCGYDWLYDLLSDAQKNKLVRRMIDLEQRDKGGRGGLNHTMNTLIGKVMTLGLAFHGDGVDDEAARRIVEKYWRNWWDTSKPLGNSGRNLVFQALVLEGGGNHEGFNYVAYTLNCIPWIAAWKTATGQDYFKHLGFLRNWPYWFLFAAAPSSLPDGFFVLPVQIYDPGRGRDLPAAATGYLADVDPKGAAMTRWWYDHHSGYTHKGIRRYHGPPLILGLLIGDPRVKGRSPSELGLSKTLIMRGLNRVYMRSNWDDPDSTLIAFSNSRFATRVWGWNSLAVWKNGGSLFQYRVGGGHRHRIPWAYNTVLFYVGKKCIAPPAYGRMNSMAQMVGSRFDFGTLSVASVPEEYDFVRGACPKAYSTKGTTLQVRRAERTLVYLRPAPGEKTDYLVVLDRTETNQEDTEPHLIFGTPFEPKIGRDWKREDEGKLVVDGQWMIRNAPCIVVTNTHRYDVDSGHSRRGKWTAHARAFFKTLYPSAIRILKIGGPGHHMDDISGNPRLPDFRKMDRNRQVIDGGYWRFHVVPGERSRKHTVMSVMELTDSKFEEPAGPLELLQGSRILGAQAGPNIVLFSKDGKELSSGAVKAARAGTVRLLVADLEPETNYTLHAGGQSLKLRSTKAGTAYAKRIDIEAGDVIKVSR